MAIYTNRDQQRVVTVQELGRGGEGIVYTIAGRTDVVAKIYHPDQRTRQKQAKLTAMLSKPPHDSGAKLTPPHCALAWPMDLLFAQGQFAGFLMPNIERSPTVFALFNPKLRQQRFPTANRYFLHRAAQNLAAAVSALHTVGYVLGDVNQKNILVKPNALVTLVDTDSFQVCDSNGMVQRCGVGVPEYTPPELQNKVLNSIDRQPYHDAFGLSVLIFQLLMEGYHPFTGRPMVPMLREVDQLSLHCIAQGIFPYWQNKQVEPPPTAPNFLWLHPNVQHLFVQAFVHGYQTPTARPSALLWARTLQQAESALVQCRRDPHHWYSNHLAHCPYCTVRRYGLTPAQRHPNQSRAAPFAIQQQPRATSTSTPPWGVVFKQLGGLLYLLLFLAFLVTVQPLLLLVIAVIVGIGWTITRKAFWRGLATLWRGSVSGARWLAPYVLAGGRRLLAWWRARSARFKVITVATAMLFVLSLMQGDDQIPQLAGWQPPSPILTQVSPLASPAATSTGAGR